MAMLTYTESEMLALWRLAHGYEPLRCDATVTRTDGTDFDALLKLEIKAWYAQLLEKADPREVPVSDIVSMVTPRPQPDGSLLVTLPEGCRRVVEVKCAGWERSALIARTDNPADRDTVLRQQSPYTRGGTVQPVAVIDGSQMHLYPAPSGGGTAFSRLRAVMEPQEGTYVFSDTVLPIRIHDPL